MVLLKLLRMGQILALGLTGAVTLNRLMKAEGFFPELFAFISLVLTAIACSILLTTTDQNYSRIDDKKHIRMQIATGSTILIASLFFGMLCYSFQ